MSYSKSCTSVEIWPSKINTSEEIFIQNRTIQLTMFLLGYLWLVLLILSWVFANHCFTACLNPKFGWSYGFIAVECFFTSSKWNYMPNFTWGGGNFLPSLSEWVNLSQFSAEWLLTNFIKKNMLIRVSWHVCNMLPNKIHL
jgi:hypothetical protein